MIIVVFTEEPFVKYGHEIVSVFKFIGVFNSYVQV